MSESTRAPRGKYFQAYNSKPSAPAPSKQAEEEEAKKLAANNLKAAARTFSGEALETLVEVMRNKGANPQTRVAAANAILERGHGKSVNQTEVSIGIYDRMSNDDLIKFITGQKVLDGEVLTSRDDDPLELEYAGEESGDD